MVWTLEARLADGHRFQAQLTTIPHHIPHPFKVRRDGSGLADSKENVASPMPLLLSGRGFRQELERAGALALYAPLEGGAETRLLRRLRAAGYRAQITSARGLGDPEATLLQLHGVRPPHLGHQSVGRGAAVGEVQRVMPLLGSLLEAAGPIVVWLLEGQVLSRAELGSLVALSARRPGLRFVVEMGGARALRWQPLAELV